MLSSDSREPDDVRQREPLAVLLRPHDLRPRGGSPTDPVLGLDTRLMSVLEASVELLRLRVAGLEVGDDEFDGKEG
jgi:hypothetical protein